MTKVAVAIANGTPRYIGTAVSVRMLFSPARVQLKSKRSCSDAGCIAQKMAGSATQKIQAYSREGLPKLWGRADLKCNFN